MRIAVTGASGRLGGQVAGLLAASGEHEVVAVSRDPGPPAASSRGVSVAVANYADPAALRAAFRGAGTLVFMR